ncbi:unnamed protein product [marine sediment metagenome]|uniref:Uncharacterized protein n=1 Tax=marine sediment metagenome TaxID=412755 RepID=X1AQJ8_9ZZZZ
MLITWLTNNLDVVGLILNAIGTLILIFIQLPPSLTYIRKKEDGRYKIEWELPNDASPEAQDEMSRRYNMQEGFKTKLRTALCFILAGFMLQGIYIALNK